MLAFLRSVRPVAAAAGLSVLLVACGDDDPSGPAFSAETATEMAVVAEDVVAPIESTENLQLHLGLAWGALLGFDPGAELSPLYPFATMRELRQPLAASRTVPSAAAPTGLLLPDEIEGTTFVWSAAEGQYVASEEPGAPASGVRFVYYAINPVSGEPALPLNALGHIDLIDESTEERARLEIVAIQDQGDVTLADYFVEGGVSGNLVTNTVTIDSEGYFSDGSDRLDFDMHMAMTGSESASTEEFSAELSANGGSITVDMTETLTGEDDIESEATFTIEGEGNRATFGFTTVGTLEAATIDGALEFNGTEVVVVSGDAFDPEFTRPDGSALTATEVDALGRMWLAAGMTTLFVFQTLFPFLLLLAFAGF
ncbi:MAG TPA: hypothetical protein VF039_09215 [Longimicrobiales bacterium]